MKGRLCSVVMAGVIFAASACSGVPIRTKNGVHYVILGIGVVSVPTNSAQEAALVTRTYSLGANVNNGPIARFNVGYLSGSLISIPTNANDVRIEVSAAPVGRIKLHAPSTTLKQQSK